MDNDEKKQKATDNFIKTHRENPHINFYGVFEDNQIVGGMRYHDFTMNILSTEQKVAGIGLIAVDLLHKKEKIARDIVYSFLNEYKNREVTMAILYPFNPEFYKNMGFGLGTYIYNYKIEPSQLINISKKNLSLASKEDMLNCYNRIYKKTNGLIKKYYKEFEMLFTNPKNNILLYKENNIVKGYMIYEFKPNEDSFLITDMIIHSILYESKDALNEFMTFLNIQSDQIRYIEFNLQDEDFRFILKNPVDYSKNLLVPVYHQTAIVGTGIMYRVINLKKLMENLNNHNFNRETLILKISLHDNFIKENNESIIMEFIDGMSNIVEDKQYDAEIRLDISEFSSLIMCVVSFESLYNHGKAYISDEKYLNKVNNIFKSDKKPICLSMF